MKAFKMTLSVLIPIVAIVGWVAFGTYVLSLAKDITFINALELMFSVKK